MLVEWMPSVKPPGTQARPVLSFPIGKLDTAHTLHTLGTRVEAMGRSAPTHGFYSG